MHITTALTLIALMSVSQAAVPVTVYYESLCPDSIKFFINQVYPAMQIPNFSTNVELNLVPYGKSTQTKYPNGTWAFECHHGERECYGNKVHACALKHTTSQNERLSYINCLLKTMLNDRSVPFPTEKCAEEFLTADDKAKILDCANSTKGDEELAVMGTKTQAFQSPLTSVPTVVFNMEFNKKDQNQAQYNFKGILCNHISDPKPDECAGLSGAGLPSLSVWLFASAFLYTLIYFY